MVEVKDTGQLETDEGCPNKVIFQICVRELLQNQYVAMNTNNCLCFAARLDLRVME